MKKGVLLPWAWQSRRALRVGPPKRRLEPPRQKASCDWSIEGGFEREEEEEEEEGDDGVDQ